MKKFKVKVKFINAEQKEQVIYLLVEAVDFADAEAKTFDYVADISYNELTSSGVCGTEINILQVSPFKVDLFDCKPSADGYVLLTIDFIVIDERTGAEKRSRSKALYAATDLADSWRMFYKYVGVQYAELVKAEMTNFYDVIYAGK